MADADKRREFVSGFNGSAGMCSASSHIELNQVLDIFVTRPTGI